MFDWKYLDRCSRDKVSLEEKAKKEDLKSV